jgi:hypothetical protein
MRRAAIVGALLATLLLAPFLAGPAQATPPNIITQARYAEPTTRYDHGVLGDAVEWGALKLTVDMCFDCEGKMIRDFTIRLPENRVFEDIAPRLVEIDGDGPSREVMVVETDRDLGARLAIYTENGLLAATPFIGTPKRWLAPLGAADLDGDGLIEIAYIDRPHLTRTLKIWRYEQGVGLTPVAEQPGLTNHRIGEDFISGGIRDCGNIPEIITANADWTRLIASTLRNGRIASRDIAPFTGPDSFAAALTCP